jgi:hypothetical protein
MEKFEIGEVAIFIADCERKHTECVIVSPLDHRIWKDIDTRELKGGMAYQVKFSDGVHWSVRPQFLRKKKKPARDIDQKVSWDDCLWKPKQVTA